MAFATLIQVMNVKQLFILCDTRRTFAIGWEIVRLPDSVTPLKPGGLKHMIRRAIEIEILPLPYATLTGYGDARLPSGGGSCNVGSAARFSRVLGATSGMAENACWAC